ncbi:unnamed protein product, partial [Rhizoctonia solani]
FCPTLVPNHAQLSSRLGIPSDEEVIGIHAVIRMAHKFIDIPNMCDPALLARLSEHLFDVQMGTAADIPAVYFSWILPTTHQCFLLMYRQSLNPCRALRPKKSPGRREGKCNYAKFNTRRADSISSQVSQPGPFGLE